MSKPHANERKDGMTTMATRGQTGRQNGVAQENIMARVDDLSVSFITDAGSIKAVDHVSFTIPEHTIVGVVGESGSGKSVTARSIIKLLPQTATTSGAIYLRPRNGTEELDVLSLSADELRQMRGREAAMVFQEP